MLSFSFFCACFTLHWARMRRSLLLFLCMALLLLLFGFGAAAYGSALLDGRGFSPLTLAIADETDDSRFPQFMAYLGEMEDIRSYARLEMTSPAEARAMVAGGSAAAALIFPRDFLESVYRGENFSPLLVLDSSKPLEVFGLSLLADGAGAMLTNAQKGVYYTMAVYDMIRPASPGYDQALREINLKYAGWFFTRSGMYRTQRVSPTGGALTAPQHYLLSVLLFFCFLAPAAVLFPFYSLQRQSLWLRRLRGAGKSFTAYVLAQILWGALAIILLLGLILAGLSAAGGGLAAASPDLSATDGSSEAVRLLSGLAPRLSLSRWAILLPGLLLTALFLSAFTCACCNTGHIFSAVGLCFILAGLFLTLSGGLVPPVLLPKRIGALSPLCPLTWMRSMLSVLYLPGADTALVASGIKLAVASLLLIAALLLCCRFYEKKAGAGA